MTEWCTMVSAMSRMWLPYETAVSIHASQVDAAYYMQQLKAC